MIKQGIWGKEYPGNFMKKLTRPLVGTVVLFTKKFNRQLAALLALEL